MSTKKRQRLPRSSAGSSVVYGASVPKANQDATKKQKRPWRRESAKGGSKVNATGGYSDDSRVSLEKKPMTRNSESKSQKPDWVMASRPNHNGFRLVFWWIWSRWLYKFHRIPQPRPYGSYRKRVHEYNQFCEDHRSESEAIVAVFAPKGGISKTARAAWGSAYDAETFHAVIGVDLDTGGGKLAKRLSCDPGKTMTVQRAMAMITAPENPWVPTYGDLVSRLGSYPNGVFIFHCNAGDDYKPSVSDTYKMIRTLKKACHTVWVDTRPGLNDDVTVGAVRASTIRYIPALDYDTDSLDDVESALADSRYRLATNDRRKYTLIPISGVPWWRFNTRTQYEYATRYGVDPSQVILIPANRYQKRNKPVDLKVLGAKSAFAEALLKSRRTELAMQYNAEHGLKNLPHESDTLPGFVEMGRDDLDDDELRTAQPNNPQTSATASMST